MPDNLWQHPRCVHVRVQPLIAIKLSQPHRLQPTRLLCPWNSPGKNTGVGCHSLLQGIFPTQGSNPGLPHCRFLTSWATQKAPHPRLVYGVYTSKYLLDLELKKPRPQNGQDESLLTSPNCFFCTQLQKTRLIKHWFKILTLSEQNFF